MAEFDNDRFQEWKQFVGTSIELLKRELTHFSDDCTSQLLQWREECKGHVGNVRNDLNIITSKLNNGLSRKVDIVEYKVENLEKFIIGLKGFMSKLALGLLLALITAVVGGYITIQNRDSFREREMAVFRDQLKQIQEYVQKK